MKRIHRFPVLRTDGTRSFSRRAAQTRIPPVAGGADLAQDVRRAIGRAREHLLRQQRADGSWSSALECSPRLESDAILLLVFLGRDDDARIEPLARRLLAERRTGGVWASALCPDIDVDASIRAYFALKASGLPATDRAMVQARAAIAENGGLARAGTMTRFFLALFGQIPYSACPAIPVEAVLSPDALHTAFDRVNPWGPRLYTPLAIVAARRPVRLIAEERGVAELGEVGAVSPDETGETSSRAGLFGAIADRLRSLVRRDDRRDRDAALARCRRALLRSIESDARICDAPFPTLAWQWIALAVLGLDDQSKPFRTCAARVDELLHHDATRRSMRVRPARRDTSSTGLAIESLLTAGVAPEHPEVGRAIEWLLDHATSPPESIPTNDDLPTVLGVLHAQFAERCGGVDRLPPMLQLFAGDAPEPVTKVSDGVSISPAMALGVDRLRRSAVCVEEGVKRLLARQNPDGGWDVLASQPPRKRHRRGETVGRPVTNHHASSSPDMTGRVLCTLGELGHTASDRPVARAVDYLRRSQRADGAWAGRWGGRLQATWLAVAGLTAVGAANADPSVRRAAAWLHARQNHDGGWGELPYDLRSPTRERGPRSGVSPTAWAVMALMAAGQVDHPAVERGIRFLLRSQRPGGGWRDAVPTAVLVPRTYLIRDAMHAAAYPLIALARYAVLASATESQTLPMWRVVHVEEETSLPDESFRRTVAFGS